MTTRGGTSAASASPFGGNGTIDKSIDFGQPELLVQNLAMPVDIAVSDDIIYSVIAGKDIISAFSAATGQPITNGKNGEVTTVPHGKPVGIAAFGGNVFVADSTKNKITEYDSAGTQGVTFSKDINHPNEITAAEGNLFVVNRGGKIGEYITEYNATTGQQIDGKLIQNLRGPIQIAVFGTDLFILSNHTISELDLMTKQLTPLISDLNASDIAAFEGQLFVTNVPNHSIDVYDISTGDLATQINGLHGRPQGIDVVPGVLPTPTPTATPTPVPTPDQSATWLLLVFGFAPIFGLKVAVRDLS